MHTPTHTGTHTQEIKRRLAGGKRKDLAGGPKLKFKPPRAAKIKHLRIFDLTLGMNISSFTATLHLNS